MDVASFSLSLPHKNIIKYPSQRQTTGRQAGGPNVRVWQQRLPEMQVWPMVARQCPTVSLHRCRSIQERSSLSTLPVLQP